MTYQVGVAAEQCPEVGAKGAPRLALVPKQDKKSPSTDVEALVLEHRENGRKLARSMLRRWRARMNAEEVDSIVDLTLCEAAKRYSPTHGASFMTFFFYHLRGYLVRAVATAMNSHNVLLPFQNRPGSDLSEIAHIGEDAFKSFLPECASFGLREVESPENLLLRKESIEVCRKAYDKLDELEQEVITRSFKNEEPLVNIAQSLGYSRCHISRVKKRALERLGAVLGVSFNELAQEKGLSTRVAASARKPTKRRSRRRRIARTQQVDEANAEALKRA